MKNIFKSAILVLALLFVGACSTNDGTSPTVEGLAIMDYDLVQLTNDSPMLPVTIKANDNDKLSKISISVLAEGMSSPITSQEIKNITSGNLNRIMVNVPFPLPAAAPSGLYNVTYTVTDAAGNKSEKAYKVNILNYQTARVAPCEFPSVAVPSNKNVLFLVTTPSNTVGDLYVSGNMEQAAGGAGDWTGGGTQQLKLTKVSTTCYYITLNLKSTDEFKITRGSWNEVMKDAVGNEADNIKWNGQAIQTLTVLNWADRVTTPPVTLPPSAIATNKLTIVADVKNNDASKYYLVKKGASSLTGAIEMTRVVASTKVAASVPRESGSEYVVVRDNASQVGVNAYGYPQSAAWDGATNPVELIIDGYSNQAPLLAPTQTLFIVGDATDGGWNNPVPVPSQEFRRVAEGKFELTISLAAKQYLLLPRNGSWDHKWGMIGNALKGNLNWQGANFVAPQQAGRYKIEVDFYKGTYKLTRQ